MSARPDPGRDTWGEEVASFLAGFARFGVQASLCALALVAGTVLAEVRLPFVASAFLAGAVWGGGLWSCAAAAISIALVIRGLRQRRIDRGALITLAGALVVFAGAAAVVALRARSR